MHQIAQARQAALEEGNRPLAAGTDDWINRSWQRCLASGKRPEHDVAFEVMAPQTLRRTEEANHLLVQAARPVLEQLGQAIASTRYFAILTNAQGVVVDVNGPIDRRDRRADLITRIGVDLSEASVGTTAIGAALTELQPVWLHCGEHFFRLHSAYSCAGAPLLGPDGRCVGMLDLTGVDALEWPELRHLVVQAARSIENALMQIQPHALLIRLNWSSRNLGEDSDGLICLDPDGGVTGANSAARQMVPQLGAASPVRVHCSDLFAMPYEMLFDAAQSGAVPDREPVEVPLWSGLRLHAWAWQRGRSAGASRYPGRTPAAAAPQLALKEIETSLIRKAVSDARGNVMKAARALGISRATVYRRLGLGRKTP